MNISLFFANFAGMITPKRRRRKDLVPIKLECWDNFGDNFKPKKYLQLKVEGISLRRHEAALLLQRILSSCRPDNVTFISLEHPGLQTSSGSEGYELHFKWLVNDETFSIIKEIIKQHNLGLRDYNGCLVIYTPKIETTDNLLIA